jgi:hypothetical protein
MYLSIDVGIKNLAYIVYDKTIIDWGIIELCETNANKANMIDLGKKIFILFEEKFKPEIHFDEVIIENQIGPSAIRMKNIQGMITMYFIQKGSEVFYWNAGNKLRFLKSKKTTYKERKKLGILITESIIKEFYPEHIYFSKNKKKDDLADCFLQLLDYLVKNGEINENIYTNAINIKL